MRFIRYAALIGRTAMRARERISESEEMT